MTSEQSVPLARLVVLFCALFAAGTGLTLPLFKFEYQRFFHSKLFVKIVFWIPIFFVFLVALYGGNWGRLALVLALLALSGWEFLTIFRQGRHTVLLWWYFLLFAVALAHLYLLGIAYPEKIIATLITICFASVLSDVTAFFMGNYIGVHKLPAAFNNKKSWEGVAGQIIGAFLGVLLVNAFVVPVDALLIFLPIGIGSALGDLVNSFIKRKLDLKDWSNNIPGHGGYMDRLSSMVGSITLAFYFLLF